MYDGYWIIFVAGDSGGFVGSRWGWKPAMVCGWIVSPDLVA